MNSRIGCYLGLTQHHRDEKYQQCQNVLKFCLSLTGLQENSSNASVEFNSAQGTERTSNATQDFLQKGLKFVSEGKVTIIIVANEIINKDSTELLHLQPNLYLAVFII